MLKNFIQLNYDEKLMILEWRNHSETSKFMLNKKIELKEHLDFINSLKELNPKTTPLNFFHPNEALPLKAKTLSVDEALEIIKWARSELKCEKLMVAGGREFVFKDRQKEIFKAGANAIVIGDYLTTSGNAPKKDIELIESLGLEVAKICYE